MFGTKDVKPMGGSAYIRPGINEVQFLGVSGKENYLEFAMKLAGESDDNSTNFRLYMASNSQISFQTSRINSMGIAISGDNSIDEIEDPTIEGYGDKLNKFFAGNKVRMLFTGKEYLRQDGNIGTKTEIGAGNFVESIDTKPSTLKFDENRHMTKLEIEDSSKDKGEEFNFSDNLPDDI
jgi:hypothetical protein